MSEKRKPAGMGRPRNAALDTAITAAVEQLLLADGYGAVTIDRVAALAGTTRTALYRRYPGRVALIASALAAHFGTDPAPDTGNLRDDLTELQRRQVEFFQNPVVAAGIAGLLGDLSGDPEWSALFHEGFMAPRRRSTEAMFQRAVDRGEIPPVTHPTLVSDILTGPLLLHVMLPATGPLDDTLVAATVDSALHLLSAGVREG
ncbi:TetR/AcrR family transcriptional regulator [Nocardia tengchongensis]|uniref:TetR/AcrR family transcriptional regulator n=1 Tax=Nocardia tengchongensis TaxID=2055889 RepID=UPI0036835172